MRRARFVLFSFAAGAAVLAAAPLRAEEAGKAGLPQFDMSYFPGQIFWLAVTFVVLYILMSRLAIPAVARTQEKRQAAIAAELAAATAASEEAKKVIAAYERMIADARVEASAIITDFTRRAAQKSLERQTEQQQALAKHVADAEARIADARAAALEQARAAVTEIAAIALEKVAGFKPQVKA